MISTLKKATVENKKNVKLVADLKTNALKAEKKAQSEKKKLKTDVKKSSFEIQKLRDEVSNDKLKKATEAAKIAALNKKIA